MSNSILPLENEKFKIFRCRMSKKSCAIVIPINGNKSFLVADLSKEIIDIESCEKYMHYVTLKIMAYVTVLKCRFQSQIT